MKNKWTSYLLIVLGSTLTNAAFGLIILPQSFAAGGVTGLSAWLCKGVNLPLTTVYFLLSVALFILGLVFMGLDFSLKTFLTSLMSVALLELFSRISLPELASDPLLSSLLAGGLLGAGSGLILLGNGSGGGFDILGVILARKLHIPVALTMYLCDFFIILAHAFSASLLRTLYGILVILISNLMVNQVLTHGQAKGQMLIFSSEHEKIRCALLGQQDVGMTFLHGETGYLGQPIKVILTVIPHSKIEDVKRCVQQIDPTAFVLMDTVHYVSGRGYTLNR